MSESANLLETDTHNENVHIVQNHAQRKYFGAACISIISGVGQGIFLPLFISTFTSTTCHTGIETGSYFVLFIMSTLFNIPFAIGAGLDYRSGKLTPNMIKSHGWILVLMGIFDGLNGLLIVFASSLNRTSGDLQAILIQLSIPFTLLFSRLFAGRVITRPKGIAALIVFSGVILAIIPNFISFINHDDSNNSSWFYPAMFITATIPGVLINVIQHKVFDKDGSYNKNWLLLGESWFQFVTVSLLFWADLIPMFGTSKDLEEFSEHFRFGFECFFNPGAIGGRCEYSWMMGSAFACSYCGSYYFGSYLIQHGSANFFAMASAMNTPIQMLMWYFITPMTRWGCGQEYSQLQIIMGSVAIPFICVGAYVYHFHDENERNQIETSIVTDDTNDELQT